jgi:hypothetical protein
MVNGHTVNVVFSIGTIDYPMKPGQGFEEIDEAYNYSVPPGTYEVVVKIPGENPHTEKLPLTNDSTWGIIVAPTGGYLAVQLY